jgi:hypothetical protein
LDGFGGVHPGGNAEDFENKRVAGKAICKTMKTKGDKLTALTSAGFEVERAGMSCRLTSADEEKRRRRAGFRTITIHFT